MILLVWFGVALAAAISLPYLVYVGLYVWVGPSGSPAAKRPAEPPVSIVLPTYNEERIVEGKLEELCSLHYPMENVEIVVADASDDRTPEIVRSFFTERTQPAVHLVEVDRRGVARAVNAAIEAASHDVVFRTDCDSSLDEDVITHAVANLQDPTIGGVTGCQTSVLGESKVEENYRDLQARNQALESHLDSTFIVHGPCFALRRQYFEPIASDSIADDTDIAVTIRKRGKRVVMDPAMHFAEAGVSDIRARRLRKDRRAMGLIQLLFRHRDALGHYGRYGRFVLPFNWHFLVVSPWLLVVALVALFGGVVYEFGAVGLALPGSFVGAIVLGNRDRLGPFQPVYAVLDSQLSLLIASIRLLRGSGDGTWEVDTESRGAFR